MKNLIYWATMIITVIVDILIMGYFHNWCANAPRTTVLWYDGAFSAYSTAYFMGIATCIMCSLPALILWLDRKYFK